MAMLSTMFYCECADALPVFVQERHIYLRETVHNACRHFSYVLPVLRAAAAPRAVTVSPYVAQGPFSSMHCHTQKPTSHTAPLPQAVADLEKIFRRG
jgi:hypothetical protein